MSSAESSEKPFVLIGPVVASHSFLTERTLNGSIIMIIPSLYAKLIKFKNASQGKTANTAKEQITKDSEYHYKYDTAQNRSRAGKEPTNERNSTGKTTQEDPKNGSAEYRIKFKQDARQQHSNDIKTNAASGKTTIKGTHIPNSNDANKHLNRRILIDVVLLFIVMPLILRAVGSVDIIMAIFGIIDMILILRIIHNICLKRRYSKR